MKSSRRLPALIGLPPALIAVVIMAVALGGCGGSGQSPAPPPPSATLTPTAVALPASTSSLYRDSDILGLRYKVVNWLQLLSSSSMGRVNYEDALYGGADPDGGPGGALMDVSLVISKRPLATDALVRALGTDTVARMALAAPLRRKATIRLIGQTHATSVGPGWPAATAMYRVTIPKKSSLLFDQRKMAMELFGFYRGKRLYFIAIGTAPPSVFTTHRKELEKTLETVKRLP